MGAFYETIPDSLIRWCLQQQIFWVSTAPLAGDGHVNVSPKGGQYFGIPDDRTFWYMDLTGSGCETISHILEPGNGRVTIMFNAFDGPPKIVRFWGKGRVLEKGTKAFDNLVEKEKVETLPGTRSIVVVDIHQVGSSCGFSVPLYEFKEHRPILNDYFAKKQKKYLEGNEKESMEHYWALKSAWSMDGLPGMRRGLAAARTYSIEPIKKMVGPSAPTRRRSRSIASGPAVEHILIAILAILVVSLAATHPFMDKVALKQSFRNVTPHIRTIASSLSQGFASN